MVFVCVHVLVPKGWEKKVPLMSFKSRFVPRDASMMAALVTLFCSDKVSRFTAMTQTPTTRAPLFRDKLVWREAKMSC